MIHAVIDTNVLISALLSSKENAATVQLLQKVILGEIVPVYSEKILSEYQEVLQRQKFKFPAEDQIYLLSAIKKYGKHINPVPSDVVLPDKKDLPFYEAAVTSEGQYLVTGNKKHFPNASFILTPREMLSIMDEP